MSPGMPPQPPPELSDAQAIVWRDTVSSLRGDWLNRSAVPLLIEYCRHVCRARLLEGEIARFEQEWIAVDGGLERLDRLMRMADVETKAVINCARQLRLTVQAQMHPRSAARRLVKLPPGFKAPWDAD
jgi:hypothetical protein